jgi:gliding motility-associated-like protein
MRKQLFAFILPLLCALESYANIIEVTTNADSGPGSLREAIVIANSTINTADTIVFNITDQTISGRTITLLSDLPLLGSNLLIDGTTQPGAPIGVTDARIRIKSNSDVVLHQGFGISDAHDIAIYGIHFYALGLYYDLAPAITLHKALNISIGAVGKGNYFTKVRVAVAQLTSRTGNGFSANVAFQSNIVNLTEDGKGIASSGGSLNLTNVRNLLIGGADENEGNFIVGGGSLYVNTDTFASLNYGYLKLLNNKFGCDITQTQRLSAGTVLFDDNGYSSYGTTDTVYIVIKGNSYDFVPQGTSSTGVISINLQPFVVIRGKKGSIEIKSNRINQLSPVNSMFYSNLTTAFSISNSEDGIVGGSAVGDSNLIAGCWTSGISLSQNKNITVSKNAFWCNIKGIKATSEMVAIPKINITAVSDHSIAGNCSLPNCTIEVFLNKSNCQDCENGRTYLGTVTSDASGNWSFTTTELLDGPVTATATTATGATGEFAHPEYKQVNFDQRAPTCNQSNGYIRGIRYVTGTRFYWLYMHDGVQDTLFTEDVENAGAGNYTFVVEQGPFCSATFKVNLHDNSPEINAYNKVLVQPSCGLDNGEISSHYLTGSFNKVFWKNAAGVVINTTQDLYKAAPGQYKLVIMDTVYGCGDSTELYTLANQSGPALDFSSVVIAPAACNKDGAIKGLTASGVTGTPSLLWVDSLNRPAGTSFDLLNIAGGKYRFKLKDAGGCDTIASDYFEVPVKGRIAADTSAMIVRDSKCSAPLGGIFGIKITGATRYRWISLSDNKTVATIPDISGLASGNYQLLLSNNEGCSLELPPVFVPQATFSPIGVTGFTSSPDVCLQNTGHIKIHSFDHDPSVYKFRWTDSASRLMGGEATELSKLKAGTYYLYASDSNGCEEMIFSTSVRGTPPPVISTAGTSVRNDHCDLKEGSITSLQMNGITGTVSYAWYNESNELVGTAPDLKAAGAGTYILHLTIDGTCIVQSDPIKIGNVTEVLKPPVYSDLIVPRYADAQLQPIEMEMGTYYLAGSPGTVQQNSTGKFTISNVNADTILYITRQYGSCTSSPGIVNLKVVDESYFAIPTAFTPNGDGRNDRLRVKVIGYVELKYFRIFNRYGQLIYETHQLNDGWNGTVNGQLQDTGSFVWVAEGKDVRGNPITAKGSFVLIR